MLQEKKREEAMDKADTVRASGHGLTPVAVITSRNANVEINRQQANIQRHEYMEQLMYRAAQEKELMDRVQQNNAMHKLEQEEARARKQEYERERFEMLAYQRQLQKEEAERKKDEMKKKMDTMHKKVKSDFENSAFYIKSKKMANISRAGSSKGVKL
jgi:RNase adaptor protein for sRNA GlmZ degradation